MSGLSVAQASDKNSRGSALGAPAVWESFVSSISSGKMRRAYDCFSPSSKNILPFKEFCALYHPVTLSNSAVLSSAPDSQFYMSGDIAQLRYVATPWTKSTKHVSVNNKKQPGVLVSALMVREKGNWHLVAPGRKAAARTEAETRNLLRSIWNSNAVRVAKATTKNMSMKQIVEGGKKLFATSEASLCLHFYRFNLDSSGVSPKLTATPVRRGLRTFVIDRSGKVTEPNKKQDDVNFVPGIDGDNLESIAGIKNESPYDTPTDGNSKIPVIDKAAWSDVKPGPSETEYQNSLPDEVPEMGDPANLPGAIDEAGAAEPELTSDDNFPLPGFEALEKVSEEETKKLVSPKVEKKKVAKENDSEDDIWKNVKLPPAEEVENAGELDLTAIGDVVPAEESVLGENGAVSAVADMNSEKESDTLLLAPSKDGDTTIRNEVIIEPKIESTDNIFDLLPDPQIQTEEVKKSEDKPNSNNEIDGIAIPGMPEGL